MRQITTVENQNIFDIALQEYGTIEAAFILISDNPQLAFQNDFPAGTVIGEGIDFNISYPIIKGTVLNIQEDNEIEKLTVKNKLSKIIS